MCVCVCVYWGEGEGGDSIPGQKGKEKGKGSGKWEIYQPAIADAPSYDAPRVTLCPDLQREDLGWVQPRHRKPRRAEYRREEENEKGGCDASA